MVCSIENVTGAVFYGYPFQNKAEEIAFEYEWNLLSEQKAVKVYCFSTRLNDYFEFAQIQPGSYVTIKGILHESEDKEALHDTEATTLYIDNVIVIDWK